MRETGIVYGNSLFALAKEESIDLNLLEELKEIDALFSEEKDFFSMLDAPQISLEEKLKIADDVFAGCNLYVQNTIKLLIEKRSVAAFHYLAVQYEKMCLKAHNIEKVTAISAVPLSQKQQDALKEKLKTQLGKEITLINKIDPSILGGVVLRTDSLQIDGGVKHRLEEIKKEIVR